MSRPCSRGRAHEASLPAPACPYSRAPPRPRQAQSPQACACSQLSAIATTHNKASLHARTLTPLHRTAAEANGRPVPKFEVCLSSLCSSVSNTLSHQERARFPGRHRRPCSACWAPADSDALTAGRSGTSAGAHLRPAFRDAQPSPHALRNQRERGFRKVGRMAFWGNTRLCQPRLCLVCCECFLITDCKTSFISLSLSGFVPCLVSPHVHTKPWHLRRHLLHKNLK